MDQESDTYYSYLAAPEDANTAIIQILGQENQTLK
jgi:hypothetical protein